MLLQADLVYGIGKTTLATRTEFYKLQGKKAGLGWLFALFIFFFSSLVAETIVLQCSLVLTGVSGAEGCRTVVPSGVACSITWL